jgi:type IV secretory pathway protease TraF
VTLRDESYVLRNDEWYVQGDNLDESTDSRQLGPVERNAILGRVWFRY